MKKKWKTLWLASKYFVSEFVKEKFGRKKKSTFVKVGDNEEQK